MIFEASKDRSRPPELYFNYLSDRTEPWRRSSSGNGKSYFAHFPKDGRGEHGLKVEIPLAPLT